MTKARKPVIRTHFSGHNVKPEVNNGKVQVIPDQSMTISEMIERQRKGLPVQGIKVPLYDPENELPDFQRMDLSELHDLRNRLRKAEDTARAELQRLEDERNEKIREDFYRKKFQKVEEIKPVQTEETKPQ